jgi:serine/threonine protein kinase
MAPPLPAPFSGSALALRIPRRPLQLPARRPQSGPVPAPDCSRRLGGGMLSSVAPGGHVDRVHGAGNADLIQPGVLIGNYQVEELLGQGACGVVHVARHVHLGRRVALKVLRGELQADEEAVQRFLGEAVTLSRLGHEHIVSVFDYGVCEGGESYYVMELLEGETLRGLLRRQGPLPLRAVLEIGLQISLALEAAHAAGVIHRDVKPENVFLVQRPSGPFVKVLDFGLAKVLQSADQQWLTRTGTVLGTPIYMSPEQGSGRREMTDHRTDIYSLGIILYELATGVPPFRGPNATSIMLMHVAKPLPKLREARPDAPEELEALVERACAKSRDDRYPTMSALKAAVRQLLEMPLIPRGHLQAGPAAAPAAESPGASEEGQSTLRDAPVPSSLES